MLSKFKHNFKIFNKLDHFKNNLLKFKLNKQNSLSKIKSNKLNFLFEKKKLTFFTSNNRILFVLGGIIFFVLTYLSIPYFYNNIKLINKIEKELLKNLNINFSLSDNFSYSFFPRPCFTFQKVSLLNQIENFGKMKVNISISKLFSSEKLKIGDVILHDVNFKINKENYNFFIKNLNNDYSNFSLKIKNSNVFYRNTKNDVLFINKINNLEYFYDKNKLTNILTANNEIFNMPYNIKFKNDIKNKKITNVLNFDLLKLKIENNLDYKNSDSDREGLVKFFYNKKKSRASYYLSKDLLEFNYYDKLIDPSFLYKGTINLKPFFSEFLGSLNALDSNQLLKPNSILIQLFKTEILNNKNLNIQTTIKAKKIASFVNLINLVLNFKISEGLIDINKTKLSWLDNVDYKISDSLLHVKDNNLFLDAFISIDINDYNEIYKFLQTPRSYRKEIKTIEFNLNYNFDQFTAILSDIKIDGLINEEINKNLNQLILRDNKLQNRIYFKNFVNQAIKLYVG